MNVVVHDRCVSMDDPGSSSLNAIPQSPTPAARTEILWLIDFSKVAGPGEATVIILRPPFSRALYAGDNWGEQLHWRVTLFSVKHAQSHTVLRSPGTCSSTSTCNLPWASVRNCGVGCTPWS